MIFLPSSIDDVTPGWLSQVLTSSGALSGGDRITSLEHQPLGVGCGLLSALHRVSYRSVANGDGTVVVKLSCDNELRSTVDQLGLYRREIDFYRDVAPVAPVRTPQVHLALQAETSTDFVLVLEDLRQLESADQLCGLHTDQAETAVEAVARLHAWAWEDQGRLDEHCGQFSSIRNDTTAALYPAYFAAGWTSYVAHAGHEPQEVLQRAADGWVNALPSLLDALAFPVTFCHGDYRADNLFFDATDGSLCVIDFQLAHRGCGISDLAYLVSQSVEGADLADHERLVRRYCCALEALGVAYAWTDAWRQYRLAVLFHLVEAVVATLAWPSLDDRGHQLVLSLVERAGRAIEVTDALSLVDRP